MSFDRKLLLATLLISSTAFAQPGDGSAQPAPDQGSAAPHAEPPPVEQPTTPTVTTDPDAKHVESTGTHGEGNKPGQRAGEGGGGGHGDGTGGGHGGGGGHGAKDDHGGHEAHPFVDASKHINWTDMGWGKKDIYGGPLGDGKMEAEAVDGKVHTFQEEEKMSPPFIFMLINFGLLLILLGKFASPAARKLAEERHDLIKNALDEAAKLRKQATERLAEYEAKLAKADSEIKALVDGMRADAESDKKRILAAAEAQAALLKKDAELRIAAEIEQARAVLSREVAIAAASATEKLLREKTTNDDQSKLVTSFIADVGAAKQEKRA